jgi:hypothetical protein
MTMLGGLLLAFIGSADLVGLIPREARRRGLLSAVSLVAVWAAIFFLAVAGLGVQWYLVMIPAAIATLWVVSAWTSVSNWPVAGIAPALAVAAALIAFVVWDRTGQSLYGFIVDWHATAPSRVIRDLALPVLVVGVGVVLFLIESANVLARFVLRSARVESDTEPTDSSDRKKWLTTRLFDGKRPDVEDLRGGRLIGPLERLLILALSLGGFFPIVVGIIAAKGIVRFPEISNDVPGGSKAEYFLVGSLMSWSLAFLAAGGLWMVTNS